MFQTGGLDLCDEISEAQMLHNEDKWAFPPREREFGGYGKINF